MVFFTCGACGTSIKKNKVENHVRGSCRNATLTCVDCLIDFHGNSYRNHVSCMSEDQKYGGLNYKPKENANKNLKKQEQWVENIRAAVQTAPGHIKPFLNKIIDYPNVPRKKQKFTNFLWSALHVRDNRIVDQLWEIMEAANKKEQQDAAVNRKTTEPSEQNGNGDHSDGKSVLVEEATQEPVSEVGKNDEALEGDLTIKKKKKKHKHKHKEPEELNGENGHGELSVELAEEAEEETEPKIKKKKKKKKSKHGDLEAFEALPEQINGDGRCEHKALKRSAAIEEIEQAEEAIEHEPTPAKKKKKKDKRPEVEVENAIEATESEVAIKKKKKKHKHKHREA